MYVVYMEMTDTQSRQYARIRVGVGHDFNGAHNLRQLMAQDVNVSGELYEMRKMIARAWPTVIHWNTGFVVSWEKD